MKFTGERYHPTENGPMRYEHLHRYAICTPLVAGKQVLDIASGEGYGSALLAQAAASVVGVDLDPEAVRHAQDQYGSRPNLEFREGRADAIPLPDGAVDIVVSFETIEHHRLHDEMLREIRRVLRPDGILIMSSPDKRVYSDEPKYRNAYHVRELYRDEFDALLKRHFRGVCMYGQRLITGSALCELTRSAGKSQIGALTMADDGSVLHGFMWPGDPAYLIGVCGDAGLPVLEPSFYSDAKDDLYREQYRLEGLLRDMQSGHEYLVGCIKTLEKAAEQSGRTATLMHDLAIMHETTIAASAAAEGELNLRVADLVARIGALEAQNSALEREREAIFASASWRVTRPLRFAKTVLKTALRKHKNH